MLKLRTISAASGSVRVKVDDLIGGTNGASPQNANAHGGVITLSVPALKTSASWVRHITLTDANGDSNDYYLAFLGGLTTGTKATETLVAGGFTTQFAATAVGASLTMTGTPSGVTLRFVPISSAPVKFAGSIDLVRPQNSDLTANVTVGSGNPAISFRFAGFDANEGAASLTTSGTFTNHTAFGTISISNARLFISDVPSAVADVALQLPGVSLSASHTRLDAAHGLALGCDLPLTFTGSTPVVAIKTGLLAGFALTPIDAQPVCKNSAFSGLTLNATIQMPSWLTHSANLVPATNASLLISKDGIGLAPGSTIPIISDPQAQIAAGPITLQFSTFTLQNDSNNQLALAIAGSASTAGSTVTFPAITMSFSNGAVTAVCSPPSSPAPSTFVVEPDCQAGTFNGFAASGNLTIHELGNASISATKFAVTSDGTKLVVTGSLSGTNGAEEKFMVGGATVTVAPGDLKFAVSDATAQVSVVKAILDMPASGRGVLGDSLTLSDGTYDLATKVLKIGSLRSVAGATKRGFSMTDATDVHADFTSGSADTLVIASLTLALSGSVTEKTQRTTIDENGGVHSEPAESLINIKLTSVQLSKGAFHLGEGTVTPSRPFCTATANAPAAATTPVLQDADKDPYYRLGWVDVCFTEKTAITETEPTKSGVVDWQISLVGNVRLRKVVDDSTVIPFSGQYRAGTFAVTADFSSGPAMHMGGESVHVGVVTFTLSPTLRHVDAEVSLQAKELHSSTFYFRHVGLEQRWELIPHGLHPAYAWKTHPVIDPDLARTGSSLASQYVPALLGFLALKHF